MTQEEIKELDKYFNCYSTRKYYSAFYYPKTEEEREVCRHMSHKEHDNFYLLVFDKSGEVYQGSTDHEIFGIELLNLDKLRIRFESFTGEQLENVPEENVPQAPTKILTYDQRVELLNQKRIQEAQAKGIFVSPGVWTSDRGPSEEYLDSQGIPREL